MRRDAIAALTESATALVVIVAALRWRHALAVVAHVVAVALIVVVANLTGWFARAEAALAPVAIRAIAVIVAGDRRVLGNAHVFTTGGA